MRHAWIALATDTAALQSDDRTRGARSFRNWNSAFSPAHFLVDAEAGTFAPAATGEPRPSDQQDHCHAIVECVT
jgi:hypothetical protein